MSIAECRRTEFAIITGGRRRISGPDSKMLALAGRTVGITLTARRIFTPEEMDKVAEKSKSAPVPGK
jgi:hypothetical protein